jgi:transcriptional regulator with AAA-type ATPase domain
LSLWEPEEREAARALAALTFCNPFLAERLALERRALGEHFASADVFWHLRDPSVPSPNLAMLAERAESLVRAARDPQIAGRATAEERSILADLLLYLLYQRYESFFFGMLRDGPRAVAANFARFRADVDDLFGGGILPPEAKPDAAHLFACFFQVRRAFHFIFGAIVGRSLPAARLRSAVWQSIFTHDLRRYQRSLYGLMGDITTLIAGPSGTGKELVARAIGLSRFIPFDAGAGSFGDSFEESFFPLNLSALSPTLIESELFGHRRGSFTGAVADRQGWLELCPPLGTVFLDEIGEVEPAIQVKLLRVLETRGFTRLGETRQRHFRGKVVAATNRDLAQELRAGRFREDFYYRLCADTIETPTLAERLRDDPGELHDLVVFTTRRLLGNQESAALAEEVVAYIKENLPDYAWPGNVRELGQCARQVLIRRQYLPASLSQSVAGQAANLAEGLESASLSAEELLQRYVKIVYAKTGSYVATAKILGLDRRTVKAKLEPEPRG